MAKVFAITNVVAKAMADDFDASTNGGSQAVVRIHSGSIPASADAARTGTTLACIPLDATAAFGAASGCTCAVLTATALPKSDCCANAGCCAGYFSLLTQAACPVTIAQGCIGTAACNDMVINTLAIVACSVVTITAFTVTMPRA